DADLPSGLGYEAAGIVDAVGADVEGVSVGDAVSVIPALSMYRWPSYGETATFQAELVVKHPQNLTWEEAAAAWMQYLTAYGALIEVAGLKAGEFVAITAASSSVGLAAIQVARRVGARPIALTRTRQKRQALLDAGAEDVVAFHEEPLVARLAEITGEAGLRVAFDPIGGPLIIDLAEALSHEGLVIEYGALSPDPTPLPLLSVLTKSVAVRGFIYKEIVSHPGRLARAKAFILEGLESRALRPIIDRVFRLDQIVEVHRHLESNAQFGKIVVTV
ncbi:MAG TPA: zinc-dependent alcohol dehydrogenase family protein, partial [Phenylobacterium sp.]|nr:zinc-dependent alcohol dehydrogenase family protein [Phenylobacterium sp.]